MSQLEQKYVLKTTGGSFVFYAHMYFHACRMHVLMLFINFYLCECQIVELVIL